MKLIIYEFIVYLFLKVNFSLQNKLTPNIIIGENKETLNKISYEMNKEIFGSNSLLNTIKNKNENNDDKSKMKLKNENKLSLIKSNGAYKTSNPTTTSIFKVPEVPKVPAVPKVPSFVKVPGVPGVTKVAGVPKVPGVPKIPAVPNIPILAVNTSRKISNSNNKEEKTEINKSQKETNYPDFEKTINGFYELTKKNLNNIKNEVIKKEKKVIESDFFPFKNIKQKDYSRIFNETASNANSKLSVPFYRIIKKISDELGKELTKKASEEIQRLRRMDIDQATDIIIDYSEKIKKSEGDYWYYFYIVSHVVLQGKIVKDEKNLEKVVSWEMKKPIGRIIEKGKDKYYDNFFEKDEESSKIIKFFQTLTLHELRDSIKGISTVEKTKTLPNELIRLASTNGDVFLTDMKNIKFKEWVGSKDRDTLMIGDFEQNIDFSNELKNTLLYKLLKLIPKGIIHHFHFTAGFSMKSIFDGIDRYIVKNRDEKKNLTVILEAGLCQEDKTMPDSYLEISTPRFFIIEDFFNFYRNYSLGLFREQYKNFKNNYILADGRCVSNPISSNAKINSDLKAFLFYKLCINTTIYTSQKNVESLKEIGLKNVKPLESINDFLKENSHILNEMKTLQSEFLPDSYSDLLFTIKDQVSVAVWFKFEMIFNIYSDLFDNDNFFIFMRDNLYLNLGLENVQGIEFRQGYDLHKNESSRITMLKNQKKNMSAEKLLISFILPGRKLKSGHKLDDLIKALDSAKEKKISDVVGFDFFGYEDDPFTGARNFLSVTLKRLFSGNSQSKEENDFDKFLNALRKGHKLYFHAGESMYFPNYPINKQFMRKFYINDNLIHSALLPNVERVGHGFAVINNELLMNIYKKKGISLEICPTSNQALQYYNVYENPITSLLRKGLYVTVSPDDPGFFNYSNVRMDWFNLMMHTDLKFSEYYLLIKYSFIKSGISIPDIEQRLKEISTRLQEFIDSDQINYLMKNTKMEEISKSLKISPDEKKMRIALLEKNRQFLIKNVQEKLKKLKGNFNPEWNIYDINQLSENLKK